MLVHGVKKCDKHPKKKQSLLYTVWGGNFPPLKALKKTNTDCVVTTHTSLSCLSSAISALSIKSKVERKKYKFVLNFSTVC